MFKILLHCDNIIVPAYSRATTHACQHFVIVLDVINLQTVFFNFFYTSAAILTIFTGVMYESKGSHDFLALVLPHPVAMKTILIGAAFSVVTFVSNIDCRSPIPDNYCSHL